MKFGENLYYLRKSFKMSQENLAEKVGVSRQSVSKWENGESYPEMDNIMKLCKIFHCKINDLVHDDMQDINSLDEEIKMTKVKFEKDKQIRLKVISKIIYIIATIGKIFARIGAVGLIVAMIIGASVVNSITIKNENQIEIKNNENYYILQKNNGNVKISENGSNEKNIKMEVNDFNKIIEIFSKHSTITIIGVIISVGTILVITLILLSLGLKHLEKLFKNIYNGDTPFTLDNVYHIKRMSYLMIFVTIIPSIGSAISGSILNQPFNLDIGFDLVTILFLYSIAYIFEYGYHIQLDSEGKIYGEKK